VLAADAKKPARPGSQRLGHPAWSLDGTKIAFERKLPDGTYELM
jgi:hypothetical protein